MACANIGGHFPAPVLRVEDETASVYTVIASCLRSFNLAGKTAHFDIRLPYQKARRDGPPDGEPAPVPSAELSAESILR
jgi:hypothetical protein